MPPSGQVNRMASVATTRPGTSTPGAPQTTRSPLLAKLGSTLATAIAEHRHDEDDFGNSSLPAGIDNGVAELVDCRFIQIKEGKQNAGEYIFYAAGIVKLPHDVKGAPVRGLRTQITEPLYPTPGRTRATVSEHVGWVMNQLSIMGIRRSDITENNIEAVAEALKKAKPHIRFRTYKLPKQVPIEKQPNRWYLGTGPNAKGPYADLDAMKKANPNMDMEPMVNHEWSGAVQYQEEIDPAGEVMDSTPSMNGDSHHAAPGVADSVPADIETPEGAIADPEYSDDMDLDSLAVKADTEQDEAAMKMIKDQALAAGMEQKTLDEASSWTEIVELMKAGSHPVTEEVVEGEVEAPIEEETPVEEPVAVVPPPPPPAATKTKPAVAPATTVPKSAPSTTPAAAVAPFTPIKDRVCKYYPIDTATKQPVKKGIEVICLVVDPAKKIASIKNMETGHILKGISWNLLKAMG